jgi:uncharacterized membrane protein YeiH
MINPIILIEFIGTFAFAISGIRLASSKQFDWFGAYVVGLVTAIGGGTIRDLLLNTTPFWMETPIYMICSGLALLFVIIFSGYLIKLENTFFLFDTIGLGLFVLVGIEKSLSADYPFWVAITMGTITGAAGGIIRDILINDVPLIFRKEIYALACVIGGVLYWICSLLNINQLIIQIVTITGVILTRFIAVRYHICLPVLKGEEEPEV